MDIVVRDGKIGAVKRARHGGVLAAPGRPRPHFVGGNGLGNGSRDHTAGVYMPPAGVAAATVAANGAGAAPGPAAIANGGGSHPRSPPPLAIPLSLYPAASAAPAGAASSSLPPSWSLDGLQDASPSPLESPSDLGLPEFDLDGGMVWPTFVDLHTHIDKCHTCERRCVCGGV